MNLLTLTKPLPFLFSVICLSYTWNALAATPPATFTASYKVEKYSSTVGVMQLSLQRQNETFVYTSRTEPKGLLDLFSDDKIFEQSTLRWNSEHQQLQLLDYQYQRAEKSKDDQAFSLSWNGVEGATCTGTARKQAFTLDLDSPVWDRLSSQLALMADLSRDNETKQNYRYTIVDNGELTEYEFQFESEQTISIGEHKYHTLKFKRPHDSGRRTTYLWLSPESGFIPVRMEQHKKGKLHFSMELLEPARVTP